MCISVKTLFNLESFIVTVISACADDSDHSQNNMLLVTISF